MEIPVFIKSRNSLAKITQLRCNFNVISRMDPYEILDPLGSEDIKAVLDWGCRTI